MCADPRLLMPLGAALDLASEAGLHWIEPAGGGHVPTDYMDPVRLSQDAAERERFLAEFTSRKLSIAAIGCYGNPLDPDPEVADAFDRDFRAACLLASQLGVERVTVISGVPGGGPSERVPHWVPPALFAGNERVWEWQWAEKLIPYWQQAASVAESHGVTICMEMIARYMVYSPQGFMRLNDACGGRLRVSIDPSHLWWQGIDPIRAVELLAGRIGFVQCKDVYFDQRRINEEGLFPLCGYADWGDRTWWYTSLGEGHDLTWWTRFINALRRAGYDGVAAYEYEDRDRSPRDAVAMSAGILHATCPRDAIPDQDWFTEGYRWKYTRPV